MSAAVATRPPERQQVSISIDRLRPLRAVPAEHVVLTLATVLAVIGPILVWFDLEPPGRAWIVVAFVLAVPGVATAILCTRAERSLWIGLAPVVSVSVVVVVTLGQQLTNTGWPGVAFSVAALIHLGLLPSAWRVAGTRTRRRSQVPGRRRQRTVAVAVLAIATVLWWWATRRVDLDRAEAFGLARVAPPTYWLALIAVVALFAHAVTRRRVDRLVVVATVIAFATFTYCFVAVADGSPVVPNTFVHLGMADAIDWVGFIPTGIDARFSWPGFFTAAALVLPQLAIADVVPALVWYPAVVSVLAIVPLFTLARALTGRERSAWVGVMVFFAANWVQQDYFSPQSFAFLVYVTIAATLAYLLSRSALPPLGGTPWWRLLRAPRRTPSRAAGWSAGRTVAIELLLLFVAGAMVVSHQLTPVALLVATGLLALFGVTRQRTLWLGVAIVFTAWFVFGATDWCRGHLSELLGGLGDVSTTVSTGAVQRVQGDPWYARMQLARIAWSGAVAVAAGIGWLLLRRRPTAWFAVAFLIGPVFVLAGQSYGGEAILRVFLYVTPVLAAYAAHALVVGCERFGRWMPAALGIVLFGAAVALTTARGVNTAFERNPADVVAAARAVLAEAPPRATVSPLRTEPTLMQERLRDVDSPQSIGCRGTPLECILAQQPDYVFLTTTRDRYDALRSGTLPDRSRRLASQLQTGGLYGVVWSSEHVVVLRRDDVQPTSDVLRPVGP